MKKKLNKIPQKSLCIFGFEGKNKTEENYFSHFKLNDNNVRLILRSVGDTDAEGILKGIKNYIKHNLDYNPKKGDSIYIFVDADAKESKLKQIEEFRKTLSNDIHIVVSNPCFEIWFINHFERTTKWMNQDDALLELSIHIKNYKKNCDAYINTCGKELIAFDNSNFQRTNGSKNPYTEVDDIVKNLLIKK